MKPSRFLGIGALLVESIQYKDIPVVQGVVVCIGVVVVLVNLAADLAYRAADPRIRFTVGGR